MHIHVVMPDTAAVEDVRSVLEVDGEIELTEGTATSAAAQDADVELIHASLVPSSLAGLRDLARGSSALVVTDAPADPGTLASYLASGVSGYHCRGEPWSMLRDVVKTAHAGGYRCDPFIVERLFEHYRALRKHSSSTRAFGPYLH